jgi:hypothetical protein
MDHLFTAKLGAVGRKGAGSTSVARQVWNEHAQVLRGEGVRQVRHDFFIGGETVEENDVTMDVIVAVVEDVSDHMAPVGVDPHGRLTDMRNTRQNETSDAQEHADSGAENRRLQHAKRAEAKPLRAA